MASVYDIADYIVTHSAAAERKRREGLERVVFDLWWWSTLNELRLFSERADLLEKGWSRSWTGNSAKLTDAERQTLEYYFQPDPRTVAELGQAFVKIATSAGTSDFGGRQKTGRVATDAGQRHTRYSDLGGSEPSLVRSKLPAGD